MRGLKKLGMLAVLASMQPLISTGCLAQAVASATIQRALEDEANAWNAGDIDSFMQTYKDSPETTFIGKSIEHGYAPILERYKKAYANRAAMGKLDFSGLTVRDLGPDYAVAVGKFHLARSADGGGDLSGIFSLVWQKTAGGWKIILDHTSTIK